MNGVFYYDLGPSAECGVVVLARDLAALDQCGDL